MTEKQAIKQMNQIEYQAKKLTTSFVKLRDSFDFDSEFSSEELKSSGKALCVALDNLENELLK
ncbi:MAG: hypothetical protein Unbinned1473contig1000_20 [Prokaryotic dsDNA virus sp.]|nr:MAG: hypothetical protein Unbinned1473contig1000_20 [Prokaryotic dsDNA virus sp.]|tara:strand:+ start:8090 stop:8278 length:189 start_codon:yes stop_codon:yes gene_type:complete